MQCALVLGLGLSGKAAVELLFAQGYQVIGADDKADPEQLRDLISQGLQLQSKAEDINWSLIKLFVVSPGISPKHPLYQAAEAHGIEIVGEAELSFRSLYRNNLKNREFGKEAPQNFQVKAVRSERPLPSWQGAREHENFEEKPTAPKTDSSGYFGIKQPAIAITGTNGKTTVTLLVEHILNTSGIKAKALGNVGNPLSVYVLNPDPGVVIVAELSSYQLETMSTPVFDAAAILNITPDHLDRYASMEEYAKAKCRLQHLLKPGSPFFVSQQVAGGFAHLLKPGFIVYTKSESIEEILSQEYRELGEHDIENAMAAWVLCKPFNISAEQFRKGLTTFKKPHHRIEFVADIDGVHFYDDSKGTNIDAVIRAVQTMKGPVILIAGGVDKGSSYLAWKEAFCGKVKRIVAIGQAAPKIFRELSPFFEMEIVGSLSAAVQASLLHAVKGDHVLLSPGCSSFDMFRDYAHRGEEFQRTVFSLRRGG